MKDGYENTRLTFVLNNLKTVLVFLFCRYLTIINADSRLNLA